MDMQDDNASELDDGIENTSANPAPDIPNLNVELATVCMVDGIWQDQPDNVASFDEERLGANARGRGSLYICLDVSGDVDGRGDLERALLQVLRDTFAASRGSISFGLSEALRAANAYLYDNNRQVARELRRMAGVSAVVLRGSDLYICQAGPAVVHVEAGEKLARFPAESDWFTEDAPLFSPQGAASAPLGIRREFASDLAHTSVTTGDVFVLGTRALTQLATTRDLAIAFHERSANEIGAYLEELGQDADLTALVVELTAPHTIEQIIPADELSDEAYVGDTHIESFPVALGALVIPDEAEPELEEPIDADADMEPASTLPPANVAAQDDEFELDWDDEQEIVSTETQALEETNEPGEPEIASEPAPVYAAAAVAMPMPRPPLHFAPPPQAPDYDAELDRRRAERASQRAAQRDGFQRALGGVIAAIAVAGGSISGMWHRLVGDVDWERKGKQTNRTLNIAVGALITFFLLLVRLVLPGASGLSTKIMPRRATSDPIWLKALALVLPVMMLALAGARFYQTINSRQTQFEALVAQADTIVKQAEVNPDKRQARTQLNEAMDLIKQARGLQDSQKARGVLFRVQDQLNELDGVTVLYFLPTIAQAGAGAQFAQIAVSDQDIFLLDRQNRIHHFVINDVSGDTKPAQDNAVILKPDSDIGGQPAGAARLIADTSRGQDNPLIVAVTDDALLTFDLKAQQWSRYEIQDSAKWGELRAMESYGGNIYLLDATNNQIHKYAATAAGYSPQAAPYFAANAQPRLSKAVDMAIDGDVWILNDNGTIQRFRSGKAVPFELAPLDTPLKNPVAIFTRTGVDALYIADAGNQRLIEFDKNGKFIRQFKPYSEKAGVFQALQDFTVNELKRKMYFVNANAAYLSNLSK